MATDADRERRAESMARFFSKWFPDEINHHAGYYEVLAERLPADGKALNLGCGDNSDLAHFRRPGLEIWGTDFNAHPELQHAEWYRSLRPDATIPFADGTFDVVTSMMVMEHVQSPQAFLQEIARVLKPGGVYVGQSIHSLHYVTWIRRLFDLVPHSVVQQLMRSLFGRKEVDTFPTHYRLNRPAVIRKIAKRANLEWVEWRAYASAGYFSFNTLLFRMAVISDWFLERLHRGMGKIYFTVVLKKVSVNQSP